MFAVVFFCSLWVGSGVSRAATMPSLAWLRAIAAGSPVAVALDRVDNVYVADSVHDTVTVYRSTGSVLGQITDLAKPISVAVDGNGRVYVGNDDADNVLVFGPDLSFLFALGSGDGEIGKPTSIAVDDFGSVYVVDSNADLVAVYSSGGTLQFTFGGSGSTDGLFHSPLGVAVNELTRQVVVVDRPLVEVSEAGRVQVFDLSGSFTASFGLPLLDSTLDERKAQGLLKRPTQVAVDSLGRIYVTETLSNLVQVYDGSGSHLGYLQDVANPLRTPVGLTVSRNTGRLYVASLSGGVVDVFGTGASHIVTAVAGAGGVITPSGSINAEQGEKISFSLVPDDGYHLAQATVDGVVEAVISQTLDLIVVADHAVAADFVPPDSFFFAASEDDNGDVVFSGGAQVASGSEQIVTATPQSGYKLVDLLVDGVSVWAQVVDNSYSFASVSSDHTVQAVFELDPDVVVKIIKADNYLADDASTYPILADAGEEVFQATGGSSGVFNWFVFDAEGNMIWWYYATGNTFSVPVDPLFANGAGVYTVKVQDRYDAGLAPDTFNVRVPMRIAPMFANIEDTSGSVAYAVTGASGDFSWTLLAEDGQVLDAPAFGSLGSSTAATNSLTLTPGIAAVTAFQVQAQIDDLVLAAAGLDTVIAGPQVIMPMRQLVVSVDDGASSLPDAVVTAVHDQGCEAVAGADGTALLPTLADTGATYAFAVQKDGYVPVIVSTNDLSAPLNVSLDVIGSSAVISGSVLPAGAGTKVVLLRADNAVVNDSHGNPVQVLADAVSGAYSLAFDDFAAGGGPYRLAAMRADSIYNLAENEGVVDGVAGDTGKDISLHVVTRLAVIDDGASPEVTFSITASPAFNGSAGEVQAFSGTSDSAAEVTGSLLSSGGGSVYSYTVPAPEVGEAANIFVRGDTGAARSANSGYFATFGYEYLLGLNTPEETSIASPHRGSVAMVTSASGNSAVALPAGGVGGDILANATLVMKEVDPQAAGLGLITCSEIVDLALTNTASGEAIINADIHKAYVTVKFDPGKVAVGDFESGLVVICYAADIAGLQPGVATVVPVNQIVKPINYGAGKVTFLVDQLGAFGVGGARGGTGPLVGVDPVIRFIGTARGWTDSGPDDFWAGK